MYLHLYSDSIALNGQFVLKGSIRAKNVDVPRERHDDPFWFMRTRKECVHFIESVPIA
jgi:hypothetical protein